MKKLGIIGGSALYSLENLEIVQEKEMETPFGTPSASYVIAKYEDKEIIFLPRHGKNHNLMPSEINYKANIFGFKLLGVDSIVSVSAVGSLKEDIAPLDIVLVDQFIDRTNSGRQMTYFGDGIVAHVAFGEPVCGALRELIKNSNETIGVKIHGEGTYINMEGPAFSTKAESRLYKQWGADVIGMTNIAEARLAREAGMCYASIAMVTDYDSWHEDISVEQVTVDMIIENLLANVTSAKKMIENIINNYHNVNDCVCGDALKHAVITKKEHVPVDTINKLKPLLKDF